MANVLDPMDLKQIPNLHSDGLTHRKTTSVLGISRNIVKPTARINSYKRPPKLTNSINGNKSGGSLLVNLV